MSWLTVVGDLFHLASIVVLLLKMHREKSCKGVSLKTQLLYLYVFLARYVPFLLSDAPIYSTVLRVFFIVSAAYTVYLMLFHPVIHKSYMEFSKPFDTFKSRVLIIGSLVLGVVFKHHWAAWEILWSASLFLEAVAILPQLNLLVKTDEVELITSHYIALMGAYRLCYVISWVYRVFVGDGHLHMLPIVTGVAQTLLYADFFYYYLRSVRTGRVKLPA